MKSWLYQRKVVFLQSKKQQQNKKENEYISDRSQRTARQRDENREQEHHRPLSLHRREPGGRRGNHLPRHYRHGRHTQDGEREPHRRHHQLCGMDQCGCLRKRREVGSTCRETECRCSREPCLGNEGDRRTARADFHRLRLWQGTIQCTLRTPAEGNSYRRIWYNQASRRTENHGKRLPVCHHPHRMALL